MEDFIDVTKLNNIHIESYMTKEEFINFMNSLRFTHIKEYDIELITGFEYNAEENKTIPRGYNIRYNEVVKEKEPEINIQSIEEQGQFCNLIGLTENEEILWKMIQSNANVIDEVIRAAKQLDRQINNK